MRAEALAIAGCYLLHGARPQDSRGDFLKLFHAPSLAALGLESGFSESYVSTSRRGTIRGLHFQRPPHDHAKLVCCLSGCAQDGIVDLRPDSPTVGKGLGLMLSAGVPAVLYLPRGIAHGFAAHADGTTMWYLVSSVHDPAADAGIDAHSAGIDWWAGATVPVEPIMSARDRAFPPLGEYLKHNDFGRA